MLKDALVQFGLSKNEVEVYLFLLKNGVSSPAQISAGTNISRPNTYPLLLTLEAKDLAREEKMGNKKAYLATDPESLYRSIEHKQETIQEILPELRALHVKQKNKPSIQFFDGKEQIKEVYLSLLESKEIFAIGSTHKLDKLFPKFFPAWIKKVREKKIVINDVLTHASSETAGPMMKEALKGYYSMNYLPPNYKDLPTDILIWDDHVALITLEEPYFATVLTNPLLSQTLKTIFSALKTSLSE
jgi:HTH-type transcriptional regulator, sugar sensing transcriptional regulator